MTTYTEASELGHTLDRIEAMGFGGNTFGRRFNFPLTFARNGVTYRRVRVDHDTDGDVTAVRYRDARGNTLVVFND